jgi:hypothetical protein
LIPWKWPLVVAAILLPVVASFYIGGGGVGLGAGGLVAVAIMVVAVRQRPRGPIVPAPSPDERRHVLFVATCPVEEPGAVGQVARAAGLDEGSEGVDVLVLAPARIRFLDRWASDVEPARQAAQRNLVATVAALAKAGVEAEARVGDEDVVQAVEDQLQTYPATDVVLISSGDGEDGEGDAAAELGSRLEAGFSHVVFAGSRGNED